MQSKSTKNKNTSYNQNALIHKINDEKKKARVHSGDHLSPGKWIGLSWISQRNSSKRIAVVVFRTRCRCLFNKVPLGTTKL